MYLKKCQILDYVHRTRLNSSWNVLSIEGTELAASKLLLYEPKTLKIDTDRMLLVPKSAQIKMCYCGIIQPELTGPQSTYITEILQAVGESHDLLARFFPLMLTLAWNVGRALLRENLVYLVISIIFINCVCLFGSPPENEKRFLLSYF